MHAKLKIDTRNARVLRQAPKGAGVKPPEPEPARPMTHDEWVMLMAAEERG